MVPSVPIIFVLVTTFFGFEDFLQNAFLNHILINLFLSFDQTIAQERRFLTEVFIIMRCEEVLIILWLLS